MKKGRRQPLSDHKPCIDRPVNTTTVTDAMRPQVGTVMPVIKHEQPPGYSLNMDKTTRRYIDSFGTRR